MLIKLERLSPLHIPDKIFGLDSRGFDSTTNDAGPSDVNPPAESQGKIQFQHTSVWLQKEHAVSFCIRSYFGEWSTDKKSRMLLFFMDLFSAKHCRRGFGKLYYNMSKFPICFFSELQLFWQTKKRKWTVSPCSSNNRQRDGQANSKISPHKWRSLC